MTGSPELSLKDEDLERYARHIVLREVGGTGQKRLLNAKVLVVGAGGLGSPLILYLAAAGVGTLGIADFDRVSLSNLQRQVVHRTKDIGRLKINSAAETVHAINPGVRCILHSERLTTDNVLPLLANYDIVADGSDNFPTRFLLNDACFLARKTLISAAVTEFDGQLATFKAWAKKPDGGHFPCYRCLFAGPPPADAAPNCSEAGVLGAAAGVMGTLQAIEVLKEIIGTGEGLAGKLLLYDALAANFRRVAVPPDPACALCGNTPTIRDLSSHHAGPSA